MNWFPKNKKQWMFLASHTLFSVILGMGIYGLNAWLGIFPAIVLAMLWASGGAEFNQLNHKLPGPISWAKLKEIATAMFGPKVWWQWILATILASIIMALYIAGL